jgi:hypothetical protein
VDCKVDLSIVIYGVEATLRSGSSCLDKDIRCTVINLVRSAHGPIARPSSILLWIRVPLTLYVTRKFISAYHSDCHTTVVEH